MRSAHALGWLSSCGLIGVSAAIARADTTPQTIPFTQDWTNIGLITANDNWSGVPGIIGYRGDGMAGGTGINPQTIVADGSTTPVNVLANLTAATSTTGGIGEFQLTNPVVGFQGSGTARAPHLVITLNTTAKNNLKIEYKLRDIDATGDNSIQPVALQYRIGTTGPYTDIPAGFVADASSGPNLGTLVTQLSVSLPVATWNKRVVQLRMITTDAAGSDEWIGVDDINIFVDAPLDTDGDGIPDSIDNCPTVFNPDQADCDQDGIGDVCDPVTQDADCDGVSDSQDNCPNIPNPDQEDCNDNTVGDACEIAANPALDCNNNGLLDSCEILELDCNGNGNPDYCDIHGRFPLSDDCNNNDIPDECETDCDGNAVPDQCQINANPALDANLDGVLDSCQIVASVVINEVLADPPASLVGDANGDGQASTQQDEFIELVNTSASPLDISGWTISTNNGSGNSVQRHQFPLGTFIAGNCSAVVFGGGLPTGNFGGAVVQIANFPGSDLLSLDNGGDTIIIRDGKGILITALTYANAANDTSITRNPDGLNSSPFAQHSALPGALLFSPGRRSTGATFSGCTIPPDQDSDGIPDATDNCPTIYNPNQADCDGDGLGDVCESDPDANANGVPDNCETQFKINEVRSDMSGSDCNEYIEIKGTPGASLSGRHLIVIGDGTGGTGVIENVISLQATSIPVDGRYLVAESQFSIPGGTPDLVLNDTTTDCTGQGLNLENTDNLTILLVSNFTGTLNQDLDTNNDGVLDITPWSAILDAVGIVNYSTTPAGGQEWAYAVSLGFQNAGPDGALVPAHVYRCEGPAASWTIGTFPITATDTPGAINPLCPAPPCPADIFTSGTVDTDDLLALLGAWGACVGCPITPCAADIAVPANCAVDTDDLLLLLGSWGPCP